MVKRNESFVPEEVISSISHSLISEETTSPSLKSEIGVGQPIFIEGGLARGLDEAADQLIKLLSPAIRDYICELADVTLHIPRWQLLLGSMMAQYESGSITSPSIDPSWRQLNVIIGDSTCTFCGVRFTPKRFGQSVCSQKCGDDKRKAEILAKNKARDTFQQRVKEAKMDQVVL